jgi:hypothetical protein
VPDLDSRDHSRTGPVPGEPGSTQPTGPGLPLPRLRPHRTSHACYTVRRIDPASAVHGLAVMPTLGWAAGDRLRWEVRGGLILATRTAPEAPVSRSDTALILSSGYLHIPAQTRYAARLERGDWVLLTAGHTPGILVVFPLLAVDEAILPRIDALLGVSPS